MPAAAAVIPATIAPVDRPLLLQLNWEELVGTSTAGAVVGTLAATVLSHPQTAKTAAVIVQQRDGLIPRSLPNSLAKPQRKVFPAIITDASGSVTLKSGDPQT